MMTDAPKMLKVVICSAFPVWTAANSRTTSAGILAMKPIPCVMAFHSSSSKIYSQMNQPFETLLSFIHLLYPNNLEMNIYICHIVHIKNVISLSYSLRGIDRQEVGENAIVSKVAFTCKLGQGFP